MISWHSNPLKVPGFAWGVLLACGVALSSGNCFSDVPRQKTDEDESALPLPRWSAEEIRTFRENLPGGPGGLLPAAGDMTAEMHDLLKTPLPFGPRLDQGGGDANADILPRLKVEDMRLFLPDSLLGLSAQNQSSERILPTPVSALKDVTPEFLAAGANALADEYLIDPSTLVTEVHQQDLTRFLEFHGRDAFVKLYVLIMAADKKLPTDANLDAMCSGTLAKGNACLLVYPLGEPWRARLFLSQAVHEHASPEFMKETSRACVAEALQSSEVQDQLRNYAVELSTRLFWLQKALGTTLEPSPNHSHPLAEIDAETAKAVAGGQPVLPMATGILAGLMALGGVSRPTLRWFRRWKRLRQQNRVWMLPEVETVPRLGGAFTGGGGAMMRYAKSTA